MQLKKRKKSDRRHGKTTSGHGARKKAKGSGNRGGFGMAGSGKRADHKKSLIIKLYGTKYFGKQGVVGRSSAKKRREEVNIRDLNKDLSKFKLTEEGAINLENYKLIGNGEINKKIIILVKGATKTAIEKIEKAGGKVILKKELKEK